MQGVAQQALKRAIELAGSKGGIQQRLGVQAHTLDLWLLGKADIPHSVFSQLTDILIEEDLKQHRHPQ
ncbi:MAG TPA: hypothetical protein VFB08_20125 [Burkholderiales bacterium]|nr:hypothetical protein [Burkholderiales bacterium]